MWTCLQHWFLLGYLEVYSPKATEWWTVSNTSSAINISATKTLKPRDFFSFILDPNQTVSARLSEGLLSVNHLLTLRISELQVCCISLSSVCDTCNTWGHKNKQLSYDFHIIGIIMDQEWSLEGLCSPRVWVRTAPHLHPPSVLCLWDRNSTN